MSKVPERNYVQIQKHPYSIKFTTSLECFQMAIKYVPFLNVVMIYLCLYNYFQVWGRGREGGE